MPTADVTMRRSAHVLRDVRLPPEPRSTQPYARHMTDKPRRPIAFTPDSIPWDDVAADGTRSATLVGSREPGVQFTYAFFIPPGVFDGPPLAQRRRAPVRRAWRVASQLRGGVR